jgi:quinol monooxygenase YgiN
MNKYGLHGKLKAKNGKGQELGLILLEASKLVAKAKGCLLYVVSLDSNDKESVWVTEVWDSKENHDHSLKNPETRALISKAMPLLDGNPEKGLELDVIGGYGLD